MRNWDIVKGMKFINGDDGDATTQHINLEKNDCILLVNGHIADIRGEDLYANEKLKDKLIRKNKEELFCVNPYENNSRPLVVMPLWKNKSIEYFIEFLNLSCKDAGKHGSHGEPYGYFSWYIGDGDVVDMGQVVGNLVDMALETLDLKRPKTTEILKRSW
jgi:hypothetical protein